MTKNEVSELVKMAVAAYPNTKDKDKMPMVANAWFACLSWMEYEFGKVALQKVIMKSKFFPTIAEIIEEGRSLMNYSQGTPTTEEAWNEVMKAVRKGVNPEWSHEYIGRAVQVVGYHNICMSETIGVERGHFFRVYDRLLEREMDNATNAAVLQINGISLEKLTGGIAKQIGGKTE